MPDDREPPRRLRAADVIDAQQATIERLTTRRSSEGASVELTRNAKGDVQISVKITDDDADEAHRQAVAIFDALDKLYPRADA